ncbi:MAG: excinuclease ABC subunit UvrC [Promethearchaeota archaeon]
MTDVDLLLKVKNLPASPGVYLMKDGSGRVIYVGKAKVLRNRVASYFQDSRSRDPGTAAKVKKLQVEVRDLDFIATDNEVEALLLENELIKEYQPKFNVQLKDDKSFPFVMITSIEKYPRVLVIRGPHLYDQANTFLGPYVDKKAITRTLKTLRKVFPFCTCNKPCDARRDRRPCIYYQLKQCPAPCQGGVPVDEYAKNIEHVRLFLEGKEGRVLEDLEADMRCAADDLDFERAAVLRDQVEAFRKTLRTQVVLSGENLDRDVVGFHASDTQAVVVVLFFRGGKLRERHPFLVEFDQRHVASADDVLVQFLAQYYLNPRNVLPVEILVPKNLPDLGVLAEALSERRKTVEFVVPTSGTHEAGLVALANKNARLVLGQRETMSVQREAELERVFEALEGRVPNLRRVPRHVEAFDISNLGGEDATGSMVCFTDGVPSKENYRKFKIRGKSTPDDYAMMREVILRRYSRVLREHAPLPDLVLVDGGKGQLNVAVEALRELKLDRLAVVGLAKREEEVFVPGEPDPIPLPKDSGASLFFQRIRDEAHRFAISYHKALREKRTSASSLDGIPGVGPATKKKLLGAFGSVQAIRRAKEEELAEVVGRKLAGRVLNHLKKGEEP